MNFYQEVYAIVRRIPKGRVVTYGMIAGVLSTPRAARAVGYALRVLPEGSHVPWWRVINSKGEISIQNIDHPAEEQMLLLKKDGVFVKCFDDRYHIDLNEFIWTIPEA